MNTKIININEKKVFPFKAANIAKISEYYLLKSKEIIIKNLN